MEIFNNPGFSLAYYLFTFFAIEASFVIAIGHWRRSLALKARRFAIAFGILGGVRFLFLLIFSFQSVIPANILEYVLALISMSILVWGFLPYFNHHTGLGTLFILINSLLVLILFSLTFLFPDSSLATIWLLWQIGLGVFLLISQLRQFTPDQTMTALGVLVLAVGGLLEFLFGGSNVAVFIRLSEMVAYPILAIAVYQEVIESINLQNQALQSLSQTSKEQIQGLISLFESTKEIISSLDLTEVLEGAAQGIARALNVDQCAIALPEENEPSLLRMVASYNPHRKGRGEAITFPLNEQQGIKHALERQRQVEMNTAYNSPQIKFLFAMMGASEKTGPLVLQPLILNNNAIGILIVGNAESKRPFGPIEGQLIQTMANQIAIAVGNARQYQTMVVKSQQLVWTLRNNEQENRRRNAAMEAELKKSREETTIISQRLYEQENFVRKSQKDLTEYQQNSNQLSQQLKIAHQKLDKLKSENTQLSGLNQSQTKTMGQLKQAEAELQALKNQVQELEFEASEAKKLTEALKATQERSDKLSRALRMSRAKIRQLASMPATITTPQTAGKELENLSCGVMISDAKGVINRVNAVATKMFNVKTSKLVGQKLVELVNTDEWRQALKKITTEKESLVSASLNLEGQVIKASISPITDPDGGQINGNVVILYDATEEHATQQARDEFVASLAQELRTPMTSIIGYVDLLLGESVGMIGDMQRKFLQRVKANIDRMDSLLNDLIGIAAIDAGQMELNPVPLDMAEIIEEAVIGAKAQLEEKEIQLKLALPEQIPMVEVDPASIQQVMLNLLSNATKSTPVGGAIEIKADITDSRSYTVTGENGEESEKWLRVAITDSGGGIAEKDVDRVFDRFYKAEHPLIQGLGETGVGLSIVKYLIEAHGGEVWFDTEIGKGTTFYFALQASHYINDPWQEIDVPPLDLNPNN